MRPLLPLFLLLALSGCRDDSSSGDDDSSLVDDDSTVADDDSSPDDDTSPGDDDSVDPFCDGVPLLTWGNFGSGFVTENCQGCHASTSVNRHDAPEEVTFDTASQVWARAEDVLEQTTGDDPAMPPQGGVEDADRTRLEWWLRCGVPGT